MKTFDDLYRKFVKETYKTSGCFATAAHSHAHAPCPSYVQEMCVIRLHDTWTWFWRELVLLSAYAAPLSVNGNRIAHAPGIRTRDDVFSLLASSGKYKNTPPYRINWGDQNENIRITQLLRLANSTSISLAIGAPPSPVEDLRRIRNFLAHRNPDTAQYVCQVAIRNGLPRNHDALDILNSLHLPGLSLFDLWIAQLRNIAYAALQYP